MTARSEVAQASGNALPPSIVHQIRTALEDFSEHLLALAVSLGGGAAALVLRDHDREWVIVSGGDSHFLAGLEGQNPETVCRLPVYESSPEVWLCVRQKTPGLENVQALCARHIARSFPVADGSGVASQLHRLDRRIRRMAEAAEMGFFRCNLTRRLLFGDERFAQIWGLPPELLMQGLSLEDAYACLHPDDRAAYESVAEDELREEGTFEFRFRIVVSHAQGPTMVRHLLIRGWRDDDRPGHDDLCSVGVVMDVSNASAVAEALRSSEAFTHLLLSSSPDCIHILDMDGCIRFINAGGIEAMELDSPIILHGVPWVDLWRGQARIMATQAVKTALGGEAGRFQGYANTMRGNRRFWDVAVTPIFGEDGDVQRLLATGRDLTEVNQSSLRLQLALDAGAIAGTWMWDDNSSLVIGDTRLAETLGLDAKALEQGVPVTAFYAAIEQEDQGRVAAAITNALHTGGRCDFEFRVHTPAGPRWFEGNGRCDLTEDGRPLRFPGIVLDIDHSKRQALRQAALVELGDRLRALENADEMEGVAAQILCRELSVSCAAYGTVDEAGTGLLIGAMRTVTLGSGSHVQRQASIRGFHAFRDYGDYGPLLARGRTVAISDVRLDTLTLKRVERFETLNIRALLNVPLFKFGRLVGVMCVYSTVPHVWTEEEIVFTRAVADRTHAAMRQAKTQQELREMNVMLEERIRQRTRERDRLWTIAKDLFVIISRSGHYMAVSPSWLRALGYTQEGLIGLRIEALCHPDDQAAVCEAFDRVRHSTPWSDVALDVRMKHRNGTWRLYNWNFNNEGDTIYGVGRDVTERNDLEEQLRQSQKMEAVGQLTGGLAHDFNNLLAGIGGSLELLETRLTQGRTIGLDRYITASQDAVRRAASLTHRLLAFSRRQPLDPVPTDVNGLVSGLETLLRGSVGPLVSIQFDLQPGIWTTRVDANQLENAVLNLCINARDAMRESGGTIRIVSANTSLGSVASHEAGVPVGDYVLLKVEDNGCGMAEETLQRAFDPFFTTKPLGKGTGLGLSMIYGFARQSGGQAQIRSRPGDGTSVSLWLPRYNGPATVLPADVPDGDILTKTASVRLSGKLVLIVDDEEAVRLIVSDVVGDLGARVLTAEDGISALELSDRFSNGVQPSVMITDIGMPGGMNGRQLAARMRDRFPDLKILFITGYAEQNILDEGLLEPGCALLVKPFSTEALARKLSQLVVPA
ncbi:PAS domain-containing protein [Gluconobacter cerinus]|uniref:GAF domain-containing hybrid sensor histidine kinase/response regulator n=1 Tax=Gluconobacter cerinus TaxID=38307 RepID=UPI003AB33F82